METKITHACGNERYTKWKTSHEDTAPKQHILQMDDAQNGEIPKTRVEHTELHKIPGKNKCPNGNIRLFTKHNNNAKKNTHRWRKKTQPGSKAYAMGGSTTEKLSRGYCMEKQKKFWRPDPTASNAAYGRHQKYHHTWSDPTCDM